MTTAQLRALYAAGRVMLNIDGSFAIPAEMRLLAGERWRLMLRKALAEVSRELAKATFTKRRK